mgnify:CR=1 FL=1
MTDFVLVHGAWGGSFAWDRLKADLAAAGHRVAFLFQSHRALVVRRQQHVKGRAVLDLGIERAGGAKAEHQHLPLPPAQPDHQPSGQHPQQLLGDLRAILDPALERLAVHRHRAHLGDGGGAGGSRPGVEDRQLAEHVRRAHDRQQVLPAVRGPPTDLHLAGDDDVQPIAGLTLGEYRVPTREIDRLQLLGQR